MTLPVFSITFQITNCAGFTLVVKFNPGEQIGYLINRDSSLCPIWIEKFAKYLSQSLNYISLLSKDL